MRPIPKKLLIHNAILRTKESEDKWGNITPTTDIMLTHVRVEPFSRHVVTKDNRQINLSATLFYDFKNSRPQMPIFQVGDRIIFDDKEYVIETIDKLYAMKKLHHIEMGLS